MRKITQLSAAVVALGALLHAAPAEAQANRTFVSGQGSDSNPCSTVAAPCRHFAAALAQTVSGGEITVLDSAGYGEFTIAQSVTITSPGGVEAGITATAGANAITIDATSPITVTLRGLTLEGGGVGANGINLTSTPTGTGDTTPVGTLNIIDCVVKDFTASGIAIQPEISGVPGFIFVVIANTFTLNNTLNGINLNPQNAELAVLASIYQTTATGNGTGIAVGSAVGFVTASITNGHADMNNNLGISLGINSTAIIKNSTIQNNFPFTDISVSGNLALYNNNTIGSINNGGTIASDGTNNIQLVGGPGTFSPVGTQ